MSAVCLEAIVVERRQRQSTAMRGARSAMLEVRENLGESEALLLGDRSKQFRQLRRRPQEQSQKLAPAIELMRPAVPTRRTAATVRRHHCVIRARDEATDSSLTNWLKVSSHHKFVETRKKDWHTD
jgi:hypothetical protein